MKWLFVVLFGVLGASAATTAVVTVHADRLQQEFQGMGCGAMFYEAHMTSLGDHGRTNEQERLYDDMFSSVRTDVLQLMIRHDHEPVNDNDDPYTQAFNEKNFDYCKHPLRIAAAAKGRNPAMKLHAVLYTPPGWMKTNGEPAGGGEKRGALKAGLELEFAEFAWAFLAHMHRHGQTIDYLSICNEPDWPHTQPSHFLTPERHADLLATTCAYLDEMAKRQPGVPRVKIIAPNNLSAVDCAKKYLPPALAKAGKWIDVVGCHDYDRRGHRWRDVRALTGDRPLWQTEACFNGVDKSPGLINAAGEHWLMMTEAFNDGVNLWMAYDWVYPPREGGEALIHLNWGSSYKKTKIYYAFQQWGAQLQPGMRVVQTDVTGAFASGISKPGVKTSAFVGGSPARLVVHIAAIQDQPAEVALQLGTVPDGTVAQVWRTSRDEDHARLPDAVVRGRAISFTLPARGLMTFVIPQSAAAAP